MNNEKDFPRAVEFAADIVIIAIAVGFAALVVFGVVWVGNQVF